MPDGDSLWWDAVRTRPFLDSLSTAQASRPAVVRSGCGRVAVRWMTPLEYTRLMGAGDYELTGSRPNQALFAFGDAVAVPVVAWLAANYLTPLVKLAASGEWRAAEVAV